MPKKKHGPNSVGQHQNAAAATSTVPAVKPVAAPAMIVPPVRTPLINVALGANVIGTVALSRVPAVNEQIQVKTGEGARRVFLIIRVTHFPPEPVLPNYVDAEVQVTELA